MKNQNIIDCYKLDFIKDIPEELELITDHRNELIIENQKLKKVIWATSLSVVCLLTYIIIKNYGKRQKEYPEEPFKKENATEYKYH
ncbi:hypothetical protein [Aquimarina algiphila]|uniref:Uncharacterized protein n=1 Tax=Aquimarina algiphila TaxID=2047982 RepID=A0A554VJP0_9FLAO|nr:hypothetical protein [Aquimarina algiphila]TSE08133.1 hypothetical protein FOF46_13835 [Aquimarina algiphila]